MFTPPNQQLSTDLQFQALPQTVRPIVILANHQFHKISIIFTKYTVFAQWH
jgi:hypothetical protein